VYSGREMGEVVVNSEKSFRVMPECVAICCVIKGKQFTIPSIQTVIATTNTQQYIANKLVDYMSPTQCIQWENVIQSKGYEQIFFAKLRGYGSLFRHHSTRSFFFFFFFFLCCFGSVKNDEFPMRIWNHQNMIS
jgi:hypothetical protein